MQDTGFLGLVHWDDPEGWYGEGGGRGFRTEAGAGQGSLHFGGEGAVTLAISVAGPRCATCKAMMPPRPHMDRLTSPPVASEGPWSTLRLPSGVQRPGVEGLEVHPS